MKIKTLKISHTSLSAWRKSPRRFLYEYLTGLRPIKQQSTSEAKFGGALDFGIAVHRFEELRTATTDATQLATQIANESQLPAKGNRSKEHLIELCRQYADHYPHIEGRSEIELNISVSDRVTYSAHLDKILIDPRLIDLKTTSKHLAYDWLPTIAPNGQAIGYIEAAKENGIAVDSLTFRGISTDHKLLDANYVPKRRDGSPGSRPPLFLDVEYSPQPHEIIEWRAALERDAQRLIEDIESGCFTCHCGIGDYCSFRQLCLTPEMDRDIVIKNLFTIEDFRGFEITYEED